jgi:hypothetical protein
MLKDFVIADAVGIRTKDSYFDLHNGFDLVQIRLSPRSNSVELEFGEATTRATGTENAVILRFLDVDWMELSPRAVSAKDVLELGYKEPSDRNHDWLLREDQATSEAHFFLRLAGDEFVRVHARRANAII